MFCFVFDAIVNSVFEFNVWLSLLVYRNPIDSRVSIFYFAVLLNFIVCSTAFPVALIRFFLNGDHDICEQGLLFLPL